MKNDTLSEISGRLLAARRILLFPHVHPDGDALGSAAALCSALRKKGREAFVLLEDSVADNIRFLTGDFCTENCNIFGTPDICVAVDCSDAQRFEKRRDVFFSAECKICLDHHLTNESFADLNYIDSKAAATGEIVFDLIREMGVEIDSFMADALYAAIETDTGGFRYSNATKKSHLITAELYDCGLDNCRVCNELYDNMRSEQLALHAASLAEMKIFAGGQAALTFVSQSMLSRSGADMSESDGIVEKLRSIRGIEISALLKEDENRTVKVSLRAKSLGDVAAVSQRFGGGGHKKAAGCTISKPLDEACREIMEAIEEELEKERTCKEKE